jgi:6-phosphofructokinase 1
MIRRIAILTGDDDAPGMNAAIRAATQTALHYGWDVIGICEGYAGLMSGDFITLTARSMAGIVQRGGTMLGSLASSRHSTETGTQLALKNLAGHEIDALIVIGGEEAQAGADRLVRAGFCVGGVAASVENDLPGFDQALGVDTALNAALDAVDHLKIPKASDGYATLVEVAGRRCGYLALASAVASSADMVVIPEIETPPESVLEAIEHVHQQGTEHPTVLMSEGAAYNADRLVRFFAHLETQNRKLRHLPLGRIQRRAAPNAFDRLLGSRLGACAVHALARGETGTLAGLVRGEISSIPLAEVVGHAKDIGSDLITLAGLLGITVLSPAIAEAGAKS